MRLNHRRGPAVIAALALTTALLAVASSSSAAQHPEPGSLTASALTPTSRVEGFKAASSSLAKTSPGLLRRTDNALVPVMIKLDQDALASYQGGIGRLAATSPSATGRKLDPRSKAARDYTTYLAGNERQFVNDLAAVAPRAKVGGRFRVVYGGVAALVPANRVQAILKIDGVVAVQADRLAQPLTDSSAAFLNAGPVYSQLGGAADAGEGLIYGNLDTGVWPEHPSFADQGNLGAPPGPARECDFGDNPLTPANDPFVCNHKLIGGAAFLDRYLSDPARAAAEPFHTARDSNGHGTHTSSTSAGNALASAPVLGVQRGPLAGMAPGAWVMEYKVCGVQGCFGSDSAAAVGQAILDGVDVINFSISGGTDPMSDPTELAFLDAYAAGVFVAASAGNDGPGAGTVNHLSPWVTTVAASTQTREFATTLNLTAGNGDVFAVDGASITAGAGPLPVVLASAAPYSRPLCDAPAAPGTFAGRIVACQRGVNARVDKGFNVLQGGAAGMVLFNPTLADTETDTHWLPAVHLADGTAFVAFMNGHSSVVGQFAGGQKRAGLGDVMAAFSSRGPAGNFIKPDVTAPGVQILAGDTPLSESSASGPPGEYFQAIAGTSMSSPHVAGAALLVRAVHPGWTPGQVKSALMTTALTDVLKEDLVTPADPLDLGAGRIDIGKSSLAPLSFDESAANYFASSADPVNAVHLNLPSVNAPVLPGRLVTTRVARNVTGATATFDVSTKAPLRSSISVAPQRFTLAPGATQELTITIQTAAPVGAQQFGEIRLKRANSAQRAHLPVAWIHTQGSVNLTQACDTGTIPVDGETSCTVEAVNNSADTQTVDLDTTSSGNLSIVAADGATVVDTHRARLHDVTLAGAQPGVPSVADGSLFGYIPLSDFGVTPEAIGDEEIINYSVPAFRYNGVTYDAVGVDSNGYVLAGGGSAEDNECCTLPSGADPARPNNILAPFWTDLDGSAGTAAGAGIWAATLTDGVDTWLVIEHRVHVFGTSDLRTFQVWIGVNGVQDITFAYPVPMADPNGQPFLMGAENEVGAGDMTPTLPAVDQRVTSTSPTPGDSASYDVTVRGTARGTGWVRTEMEATGVPGTTVEEDTIVVTRR
jgi:subtilisin family serine protease